MQKIIAVVGATGNQGSGLVRAILNDANGEYKARVLTRDANNAKAQEFAKAGAEVVTADIDDLDSLRKAFQGAYGAFCVTPFDSSNPEKETANVKRMAQAAKDAGVQHVVWSTLEDTRKYMSLSDDRMPTLHGNYKVPHFDAKGEGDQHFRDLGVPTTFLLTTYYWDNMINFMAPRRNQNGDLAITFPMGKKRLSGIAVEDIGKCAYGIFKGGGDLIGKTIGIAGENLTCQEIADALSKALGQKIVYNEVTPEAYRSFGFPGAEDLGNMFQFYRDFEEDYCARRNIDFARELNPSLQSFDAWLAENAKKIKVE